MKVFTYSEARQNLSKLLALAQSERRGQVLTEQFERLIFPHGPSPPSRL
jgi:hypothetical protein